MLIKYFSQYMIGLSYFKSNGNVAVKDHDKEIFIGIKVENKFELVMVDDQSFQLLLNALSKYDNDSFLKYSDLESALKYEAIYEQPDPTTDGLRTGLYEANNSYKEFAKEEVIFGIKKAETIKFFMADDNLMDIIRYYNNEIWSNYYDVRDSLDFDESVDYEELNDDERENLRKALKSAKKEVLDFHGLLEMSEIVFDAKLPLGVLYGHDLIDHHLFCDRADDNL